MTGPVAANSAKAALRKAALARRNALGAAERAAASVRIADRVMAIVAAEKPAAIAAYLPIRSECDMVAVIEQATARNIAVALPAVSPNGVLEFRRYRPGDVLVDGGFGTMAPARGGPSLDPDLVIVPLVGFDRAGTRLGHGRGHYDRAVAALAARGVRPTLVGVGFAAQEVESIPAEPHDARLDWIVTEDETLDLRRHT